VTPQRRAAARLIDEGYRLATEWLVSHPVLGRVVV
jgi:hypothetical protein